ncbi:MAG: TonB-dependent receptor plug domain-containing protein [Dysgonamonadaceae bacterium]|jgi:TonB-dependent SusC/RagA subfamily outer membrane receptor|nr:TonB-dependent receptor plug domain-containing protein [Dysgonamonadaceae bacterium]
MNDFLLYIFKSAIWIAIFYGIYRFFFRNETFLWFNRVFLFAGMVASFALALCQFRYPVEIMRPVLSEVESAPAIVNDAISVFPDKASFFLFIYIAGTVALLLHYGFGLSAIRKLIRRQHSNSGKKPKVICVPGIQSPFSFFGYVFMDSQAPLQDIEKELILVHETAHVEQRHWVDILLAQLVCVFQWFNPFAWLYLNAVKQNHEFLADRSVIGKGYSLPVYQAVLINNTLKAPVFAFTNSFAYYKFKRITIMKKNVSKPAKKLAVLLLLPALAVFLTAFAQPEYHYSNLSLQPEVSEVKEPVSQDTVGKTELKEALRKVDVKSIRKTTAKTPVKEETVIKLDGTTEGKPVTVTLQEEVSKSAGRPDSVDIKNDTVRVIRMRPSLNELEGTPNSPLFIVDGQEVTSISNLDAKNIESMSILKDASATSIYGEKGKNGVVIIEMKKKE